ncbi:MAG: UvrD-helicase domain-containing protein [Vicinamibacterales bacterium]
MSWLVPPSELTPEQQRAVQLSPFEHRAIVGGPGSGKTQVLLHRARYLCDSQGVNPERFRIFVFTNVLKAYIRSALRDLRLPESAVSTFDLWCRDYYREHIGTRMPWNAEEHQPDFGAIRQAVQLHAAARRVRLFDFVLVDEGQDLDDSVFAFLRNVSGHVTVCLDSKQQIYDKGGAEAAILTQLGIRRRNINLIDAFRVCPYLVTVAATLIPDAEERAAFLNQTRQPQVERQTPLMYVADDFDAEKAKLAAVVRERQLKNERIAILLPTNRQVFGFAQGLSQVGLEVEAPEQRGRGGALPAHDFDSDRPKIMSYHSAKGLTFDSVLMPRLVPQSFARVPPERVERLLFVAITRATNWCYFSATAGASLEALRAKVMPLAELGHITVLKGVGPAAAPAAAPAPAGGQLDFL